MVSVHGDLALLLWSYGVTIYHIGEYMVDETTCLMATGACGGEEEEERESSQPFQRHISNGLISSH